MKELKGKCKTCFGCNLLENLEFEGKNECEFYEKANRNWFMLIVSIIDLLAIALIIYGIYRFSILCGG